MDNRGPAEREKQCPVRIVDEKGKPVIGASVIVKGTQKGAVTDADGRYVLLGVGSGDALQFSYLGYYTVTEKVGTRTTVDAVLSEMSNMLNDVVVVGYGAQKRASITGAVASVGDSDLDRVHSATTSAMLSGKLPGLSFRQADRTSRVPARRSRCAISGP